jgi:hypothetical protein
MYLRNGVHTGKQSDQKQHTVYPQKSGTLQKSDPLPNDVMSKPLNLNNIVNLLHNLISSRTLTVYPLIIARALIN